MQTTRYQYPQYLRIFTKAMNLLGFLMPVYIISRMFYQFYAEDIPITWEFIFVTPLLAGLALVTLAIMLLTANFFPEIIVSGQGLEIKFLWRYLPVSWAGIVGVTPKENFLGRTNYWIVKTNALTPLHRVYGILYGHTTLPCFIISSTIENYDELIHRINHKKPS